VRRGREARPATLWRIGRAPLFASQYVEEQTSSNPRPSTSRQRASQFDCISSSLSSGPIFGALDRTRGPRDELLLLVLLAVVEARPAVLSDIALAPPPPRAAPVSLPVCFKFVFLSVGDALLPPSVLTSAAAKGAGAFFPNASFQPSPRTSSAGPSVQPRLSQTRPPTKK